MAEEGTPLERAKQLYEEARLAYQAKPPHGKMKSWGSLGEELQAPYLEKAEAELAEEAG